MRSYNNLYEPMLQDDYIKQRFINASKKKKNRNDVREVLENLDEHTELLKKMLTEELFIPDYHKPSIINESSSKKTRRILKPYYKYEQVIDFPSRSEIFMNLSAMFSIAVFFSFLVMIQHLLC